MPQLHFSPGERTPVPIVQEVGWAPELVWTQRLQEKSFRPCQGLNLNPRVIQPETRHYTDWATQLTEEFVLVAITDRNGSPNFIIMNIPCKPHHTDWIMKVTKLLKLHTIDQSSQCMGWLVQYHPITHTVNFVNSSQTLHFVNLQRYSITFYHFRQIMHHFKSEKHLSHKIILSHALTKQIEVLKVLCFKVHTCSSTGHTT
jgi:hypothetical protein